MPAGVEQVLNITITSTTNQTVADFVGMTKNILPADSFVDRLKNCEFIHIHAEQINDVLTSRIISLLSRK
jgi:hypothetical protein